MAHIFDNRVLERSISTGTGWLRLMGASTGFRQFADACAANDTFHYLVVAVDGLGRPTGPYEYGRGTLIAHTDGFKYLQRDSVVGSSAGTQSMDFDGSEKLIALTNLAPTTATLQADWRAALGAIAKTGDQMQGALDEAAEIPLAAAGVINIGAVASNNVEITGSTTITSLGVAPSGTKRRLRFTSAAPSLLTHNAVSLPLPNAQDFRPKTGDLLVFMSRGGGNWSLILCVPAMGITQQGAQAVAGHANKLSNSAMMLNGRGTSGELASALFPTDRWRGYVTTAGAWNATWSSQLDGPPGFPGSVRARISAAGTPGVNDYLMLMQGIEGWDWRDMGYGTAGGQHAVLTFCAKSSVPGLVATAAVRNAAADRSFLMPFTIGQANTWERKVFIIPPCTDGVWETQGGAGAYVSFCFASGMPVAATGGWKSVGNVGHTGITNLSAVAGATASIASAQLRCGSFDMPDLRTDVASDQLRCQRYFASTLVDVVRTSTSGSYGGSLANFSFPASMRVVPTVTPNFISGTYGPPYACAMRDARTGVIWYANNVTVGDYSVVRINAEAEL